jgi:putative flippase GtrA
MNMRVPMTSFVVKGIKFAIAGGLGVLTGLAIQYLLTSMLHVYYIESAVVGYGAGFVVNYTGNILNGNIKLNQ